MDAIETSIVLILFSCALGVLYLGWLGHRREDGVDTGTFYGDELAKWLATASEYGLIRTRITLSSQSICLPGTARFLAGLAYGNLRPLRLQTEIQLLLCRSDSTTVVLSQHGRSSCVFRIESTDDYSVDYWADFITTALKTAAKLAK